MKKLRYVIPLLFLLILAGCKDNPVDPLDSMSDQINNGRPYKTIRIHELNGGSRTLDSADFRDAYAEDGLFVIVLAASDIDNRKNISYFNLSQIKQVNIEDTDHSITISY